jgi:hypothetical protein
MPDVLVSWWLGLGHVEFSREVASRYAVNRGEAAGRGHGSFAVTPTQRAAAVARRRGLNVQRTIQRKPGRARAANGC